MSLFIKNKCKIFGLILERDNINKQKIFAFHLLKSIKSMRVYKKICLIIDRK